MPTSHLSLSHLVLQTWRLAGLRTWLFTEMEAGAILQMAPKTDRKASGNAIESDSEYQRTLAPGTGTN